MYEQGKSRESFQKLLKDERRTHMLREGRDSNLISIESILA
jgi:hypothetical protein